MGENRSIPVESVGVGSNKSTGPSAVCTKKTGLVYVTLVSGGTLTAAWHPSSFSLSTLPRLD